MNRARSLPAVLISLVALAVLGAVFTEVYFRELLGRGGILGHWFGTFVAQQANPFPGRLLSGQSVQVIGWLLGLIVLGLVVWGGMEMVARRTGDVVAMFLGAWMGTVLGAAAGSLAAALVTFTSVSRLPGHILAGQLWSATAHGLYWGVISGLVAAFVGTLRTAPTNTFADSLNPPLP